MKKTSKPLYSVKSVSELTGIKPVTLRAWERRYNLIEPSRQGGQRLYTQDEVGRLEQITSLVGRGHRIGDLANMDPDELRMLASGPTAEAGTPSVVARLIEAALDYDANGIDRQLAALFSAGPIDETTVKILSQLFIEVGKRWREGSMTILQERLLSQAVKIRLSHILHAVPPVGGYRIVCSTPSGEFHELGLLLFAFKASTMGLPVRYLGPDLPLEEIARACQELQADIAALSMTRLRDADRNAQLLLEINRYFPRKKQVWIGGGGAAGLRGDRPPDNLFVMSSDQETERLLREYRLSLFGGRPVSR